MDEFDQYAIALGNTAKILDAALKRGCVRIGIQYRDSSFKRSEDTWFSNNIFADDYYRPANYPKIWDIARDCGFYAHKGIDGSARITNIKLIKGIWEYIDNQWVNTSHPA